MKETTIKLKEITLKNNKGRKTCFWHDIESKFLKFRDWYPDMLKKPMGLQFLFASIKISQVKLLLVLNTAFLSREIIRTGILSLGFPFLKKPSLLSRLHTCLCLKEEPNLFTGMMIVGNNQSWFNPFEKLSTLFFMYFICISFIFIYFVLYLHLILFTFISFLFYIIYKILWSILFTKHFTKHFILNTMKRFIYKTLGSTL